MKQILCLIFVLIAVFLISCDPPQDQKDNNQTVKVDPNSRTLQSDMYLNCWFNEHTLQKSVVHSKPFASKIDSTWPDSYGFRGYVKDLDDRIPKFVEVDFWTFFSETGIKTDLVVSVDSADKNKFWTGASLIDSVKTAQQWQNLRFKFTLPAKIGMEDKITVYVWNHEKKTVYVDDIGVRFSY